MAFNPTPCPGCGGGGTGAAGADVEQHLLCDVLPNGDVVGTALAVYEYDETGTPVGAPTFVDPVTGLAYVPQGVLQPCPGDIGCLAPVQFCFTTTSTGPVEHPGREYDALIPLNPGFTLESVVVDGVVTPQNLVWDVNDSTGQAFADELETRLATMLPDADTITVTPPGSQSCGNPAGAFNVHIECLRLDQDPPDVIRFNYNGGEDLIQNPAYNETPPLNPPVSQGNYGFRLLAREDDPGPFPGNQPAERADCTSVANRGWETNDSSRTFEIWGQDVSVGVTPTPRGTPIQEVNSDGNPGEGGTTIWQTFQVVAGGNFNIRVVHGARDPGEVHTIRLSTGDTDFSGPGDLINDVTNPNTVYGGGAWTVLNQVVALAPGVYTLSFKSSTPAGNNRGGLFTDMRAFVDVPGQFSDADRTDGDCVVETEETSTTTVCQYWAPHCQGGDIISWRNVETNEILLNAAFWGQVPSPECCTTAPGSGGGTVTPGNLVHNYLVCGIVGGVPTTLSRVVYTNQSGGVVAGAFIGPDGGPVNPSSYTVGPCVPPTEVDQTLGPVCWQSIPPGPGARTGFLTLDAADQPVLYDETGTLVTAGTYTILICPEITQQSHILCDAGNADHQFLRWYLDSPIAGVPATQWDFELDGATTYLPVGPVGLCGDTVAGWESICYTLTSTGARIHSGTKRHDDSFPPPGFLVFSSAGVPVNTAADGYTQVPCVPIRDVEQQILCDATPTRFLRTYRYDSVTGVATVVNTTLDGVTPFAPVGAVGVCATTVATDLDFDQLILCDSNGTQFLRRYTFNSTTGAVTATTNLTLAGAAFAPVGAVSLCTECCAIEIGQGCSNVGSLRYTALRNPNGTISLIDSVSGAAITGANVVACASDDTVKTLNAQHRLVADADAVWTPGADVVGVLTSVTATVLTGTATIIDSNGTSAAGLPAGTTVTWTAEDDNTLTGPQSIDAIGGLTYVAWTQR